MDDLFERLGKLSPKRLALLVMDLQAKLEASEQSRAQAIAIIGMGCRFPGGANTPGQFWENLVRGVDAISTIPKSRWDAETLFDANPDAPGKIATRWGGFLDAIDRFEPQFFGISPREAISMDPQQRLMLEVSWETLESAGYAPDKLVGSKTGVFVGVCNSDYAQMLLNGADSIDMYVSTGGAHSVVSGRISYILGLQGPAVSIDTACSSSLVAIHQAVQSLRTGECRMALAGGVNVILSPDVTVTLSRAKMMASDGRCKAFDAAADGFVRSEGCGVVLLKPLADALADGDSILAVIRGSACNQDGRSNGLTAPNGPSQVAVIRAALADAGIEPSEVGYVETHGTGTSLGDPIEAQALGAALGKNRSSDQPLMIGSVKTNLGHLESAAGVAGLIKLVLCLQHGFIPPNLHFQTPSPYIPWDDLPLTVPTDGVPWEAERRIGGVSSFGFSGTNVHMLVESAPRREGPKAEVERPLHLLALAARTESSLVTLAERYAKALDGLPESDLPDVCYTAAVGRSHLAHRLAVTGASLADMRAVLATFARGEATEQKVGPAPSALRKGAAFLFTGQGSQVVQMGRELYETQPTFRAALDRCDELLRPVLDVPLLAVLYPEPGQLSPLHDIAYAQPAQFSVEYALAELWRSWGIIPSVVLGHSVGEYAAACAAGVFSLEDALKLVMARARLMQSVADKGAMATLFTSAERAATMLRPYAEKVSIAAVNGPESVVISGEKTAVEAVIEALKAEKTRARRLQVTTASHSPLMQPLLDAFMKTAREITYHPPQVDIISGLTGQLAGHEIATPEYWRRHMREAVQFYPAVQTLYALGYRWFLEIGPAPNLLEMGQRCLDVDDCLWLPSLRPGHSDWAQMLHSLGTLYTAGAEVDWAGFDRDYPRRRLALPTYPFQRERYWADVSKRGRSATTGREVHPLLGVRLRTPVLDDVVFESHLSATYPAYLDHHRIYNVVILPSPAMLEMALAAAETAFGPGYHSIENFTIQEALILPEDGFCTVQLVLTIQGEGLVGFSIYSLDGEQWKRHASGQLRLSTQPPVIEPFSVDEVRARCPEQISGEDYYGRVRDLGLEFGSMFRGIRQLWRRDGEAVAHVALPDTLTGDSRNYHIHPAFLDACFHLLGAPLPDHLETAYLLIGIERFTLYRKPVSEMWNHTLLTSFNEANQETFSGSMRLYDTRGALVAEVEGLQMKRAPRETQMRLVHRRPNDWLYTVEWLHKPNAAARSIPLAEVGEQASRVLASLVKQHGLETYAGFFADLNPLIAAYIVNALHAMGLDFAAGARLSADDLASEQDYHRRRANRLLEMLHDYGLVEPIGASWHVIGSVPTLDISAYGAALREKYPAFEAELALVEQCGAGLADVLQGDLNVLDLLFPGGSMAALERLYQDAPFARVYNTLVQEVFSALVGSLPDDRPVRVLEIGAGTGATTSYLVPHLPGGRANYTFSDLSPLFLERAKEKFAAHTFVQYALLDIEHDPAGQGLSDQQYDLIVAANVFHATRDLRETLAHTRSLLAPGGVLVLLEGTAAQPWVDITFGLTEGWWRYADTDIRPAYPLLDQATWLDLLATAGFDEPIAINGAAGIAAQQAVMLARSPSSSTPWQLAGHWLIFSDKDGIAQTLAAQINSAGGQGILVQPGERYTRVGERVVQINPFSPDDYQLLLADIQDLRGIVYLSALTVGEFEDLQDGALEDAEALLCGSAVYLTQALAADGRGTLWLVTRGAQSLTGENVSPAQATLWGLGRVISLENPEIWGGLVDLDSNSAPGADATQILAEIAQSDGEDQIAFRGGARYVPRLTPCPATIPQPASWDHDGTYLITGGLGGLGLKIARWMAEQGAGHITLIGRHGLPARAYWDSLPPDSNDARKVAAIHEIEALGARVMVETADVTDRARMEMLFAGFGGTLPPLRGIVHAAAALSNSTIAEMELPLLLDMLRPKVAGTRILHDLSLEQPLDFFVLFSSTTALWGSKLLGHYAAANTFLDAFASYRRAHGFPALSINWGTWDEMRVATLEGQAITAQFGLNRMPSEQALVFMGDFVGSPHLTQIAVAAVDWSVLKPAYEAKRQRPFLERIQARHQAVSGRTQQQANKSLLLSRLNEARVDDRHDLLVTFIRTEAGQVLGMTDPEDIDIHQGLFEMGMDSLMSVELKSRLEMAVEKPLPSTLTFNYPTVAELAGYLETNVLVAFLSAPPDEPTIVKSSTAPDEMTISADEIDELSEDELAALLSKKLGLDR